jgi:hypothetical protein
MHKFSKLLRVALLPSLLFVFSTTYCQKELWGYRGIPDNYEIVKVPLNGTNADVEVMHTFDPTGLLGRYPRSMMLQASNGKLYGIAVSQGGQDIPWGVLFEYDPVTEEYRVLNNTIINGNNGNLYGLTEPVPGLIYGTTNGARSIFKYNIETEQASIVATIPEFPYQLGTRQPQFDGELMKASDGHLYITTSMAPSPQNVPYPGGIYRLNLSNGQLTKVFVFGWDGSDVQGPMSGTKLVEALPGKLYGTSMGGLYNNSGTIFEYTIATASLVKKYDFNYATVGRGPSPLIADNGYLYGLLVGFHDDSTNYPNRRGSVFKYDVAAGTLEILHDFTQSDNVRLPNGMPLKASNGKIYGGCQGGHFEYDLTTDEVALKITGGMQSNYQPLIEVCRKPSYPLFETTAFVVCEGEPFEFSTQNTNAESYVWRKGSAVQSAQTTATLNLTNTTIADSGIYTCTMTNECGTTITMPIQLTVEACMGIDDVAGLRAIKLYPNPATNILNIQLPANSAFEVQNVTVVNMLGQSVYTGNAITIDTGAFVPGVYQLMIATDKGNWNGRFIKQ